MEKLRGKFRGTTVLPQTERECQVVTLIGVAIFFIGLFVAARDAILFGALVIVLGVISWVMAARRAAARRDAQP